MKMKESKDIPQPQAIGAFNVLSSKATKPQEYYDRIKQKFAEERDLRLKYRPEGTAQYTSDLTGALAKYEIDPYGGEITPREPINDTVECLFIGGGFSALLTSARLRENGVERSEEHTSELQSRLHLVCRLLLEKKKTKA